MLIAILSRVKRKFVFLLVFLFILSFFLIWSISLAVNKKTEVDFLSVGQGDAILIKSKYGQDILIDGGGNNSITQRLSEEMPWLDKTIDLAIISHPHEDHIVGQVEALRKFFIGKVLYTGIDFSSPSYEAWKKEIAKQKIPLVIIDKKQRINLGPDSYLEILYPEESLAGKEIKNLNNSSMVVRFVEADKSFLFVGDIEREVEERLIKVGINLHADVLKAGHQGSDTSSGEEFLKKVQPKYAVIEVGENKFGHPSPRVIKRLKRLGAEVFRTDLDGTVRFLVDGESKTIIPGERSLSSVIPGER